MAVCAARIRRVSARLAARRAIDSRAGGWRTCPAARRPRAVAELRELPGDGLAARGRRPRAVAECARRRTCPAPCRLDARRPIDRRASGGGRAARGGPTPGAPARGDEHVRRAGAPAIDVGCGHVQRADAPHAVAELCGATNMYGRPAPPRSMPGCGPANMSSGPTRSMAELRVAELRGGSAPRDQAGAAYFRRSIVIRAIVPATLTARWSCGLCRTPCDASNARCSQLSCNAL